LIADVHMPAMTGLELHGHLIGAGYAIPTILVTAYPDDDVRARALERLDSWKEVRFGFRSAGL
jgi:FixJ family two-component response regulator